MTKKASAALPAVKQPLRPPTDSEAAAILAATGRVQERGEGRRNPPVISAAVGANGAVTVSNPHADAAGWGKQLMDVFGTASEAFAGRMINDLANGIGARGDGFQDAVNEGLAFVAGIAPADELEAVLAVQLYAAHSASIDYGCRARKADTLERLEAYGRLSAKSTRIAIDLVGALTKLRTAGKQTVEVVHIHKHVHVAPGGQAIVGDVHTGGSAGGGGRSIENRRQSVAPQLGFGPGAPCAAVLCEVEAIGGSMSGPCGEGEAQLSDAWREGRGTSGRGKRSVGSRRQKP